MYPNKSRPEIGQRLVTIVDRLGFGTIDLGDQFLHGSDGLEQLPPLELTDLGVNIPILGSLDVVLVLEILDEGKKIQSPSDSSTTIFGLSVFEHGSVAKNADDLTGGVTARLVGHHDFGNLRGVSVTIVIEEILHDIEDQRLGQR